MIFLTDLQEATPTVNRVVLGSNWVLAAALLAKVRHCTSAGRSSAQMVPEEKDWGQGPSKHQQQEEEEEEEAPLDAGEQAAVEEEEAGEEERASAKRLKPVLWCAYLCLARTWCSPPSPSRHTLPPATQHWPSTPFLGVEGLRQWSAGSALLTWTQRTTEALRSSLLQLLLFPTVAAAAVAAAVRVQGPQKRPRPPNAFSPVYRWPRWLPPLTAQCTLWTGLW
jgi:hypothetical protein